MADKTLTTPEENSTFVDKVRGVFRKLIGADVAARTTEFTLTKDNSQHLAAMQTFHKWYQEAFSGSGSRLQKYDRYRFLDENLAEASASLNVYADNIVSGAVGGEENYRVMIDENTKDLEKLEEIVTKAEKQTNIKDDIWEIARELTEFGDVFTEVVVTQKDDEIFIDKLKPLPEKEMFLDLDERGIVKDPDKPFLQRLDPASKGISFDEWRVIHFKIGRRPYGVDRSLFANASQRVGRQLLWIDEALVLARLSRAWMRYAFQIDTKGLSPDQKWDFVDKFMDRVRRRELIDRTTGKIGLVGDNLLMPDEDIGIPVADDSRNSVQTLSGDTNLGNIYDVKYLQGKMLMALTMPKAYVSLEEGIGTRATLAQIDIQFARQVRRRQQAMIPGLRKFYRLVFTLAGVDPDSFEWEIEFPELATADEMIRWQVEQAKALVARTYLTEMGVVNVDYVLHEILNFDDEEVKKYGAVAKELPPDAAGAPSGMTLPPATAEAIRKDPQLRLLLDQVKDMVAWKVAREAKMKGKTEVGIGRAVPLVDLRDDPKTAI